MKLLVVEDDPKMREVLDHLLRIEGYEVSGVANSADALSAIVMEDPDLVLLDVALGTEDGRELLSEIRFVSDLPVVFLTGRGLEIDRIDGLKMGADDYVVKPFSPGELTARIESVLRRTRSPRSESPTSSPILRFGQLSIDPLTREVHVGEQLIELTAKEFDVLVFLASSPRQVFSRQQLLEHVWDSSGEWQDDATVTEHIRRVRRKIEADPDHPQLITTVRGVGYRFELKAPACSPFVERRAVVRQLVRTD